MLRLKAYKLQEYDLDGVTLRDIGYVSNENEANKWINESRWNRFSREDFLVYDTLEEMNIGNENAKKEKALAKLTPAERKLLGLS